MKLYLKANEDKRIRAGHLWIFSNEVDNHRSPLKDFQAGQIAQLYSHSHRCLGVAYVNPNSLICARLLDSDPSQNIDIDFFLTRLSDALSLRQSQYANPYYRLAFSEADYLPGLVVDRYNDCLVVQINSYGMEVHRTLIVEALNQLLNPQSIILKNDSSIRELEGLPRYVETVKGNAPNPLVVKESALTYSCDLLEGQKTGWFYDHRDNRELLAHYVKDARVLDVYSYVGAWSLQALHYGAATATAVDSSAKALEYVQINAEANGLAGKIDCLHGDALEQLRELHRQKRAFDVIVLDPPAFIKRKKDAKKGLDAYQQINSMAMRLLPRGGFLISASCSYHLSETQLKDVILRAAKQQSRRLQFIQQGFQSRDHPWHPAITETRYLKCYVCRVL